MFLFTLYCTVVCSLQSGTLGRHTPDLAVDGDGRTCSLTPGGAGGGRWWQVSWPEPRLPVLTNGLHTVFYAGAVGLPTSYYIQK